MGFYPYGNKGFRFFAGWLTLIFLYSCSTADFLGEFNLISPQEEIRLGNQLEADLDKQQKRISDPEIAAYIQDVGRRLVSVSAKPNDPFTFHVVQDASVNAFAIPGGHLYVQTGLILAAETESEVASVMAHELGHAVRRHPTKQMSRQMGTQMLMGMLLGKNPGTTQQVAATLITNGGMSAYSRSAEREADTIAIQIMNRAGYDPNALVTFFQKLQSMEQKQGSAGITFFSSHPNTLERIQSAKQQIQALGRRKSTSTQLVGDFSKIQSRVRTLISKK